MSNDDYFRGDCSTCGINTPHNIHGETSEEEDFGDGLFLDCNYTLTKCIVCGSISLFAYYPQIDNNPSVVFPSKIQLHLLPPLISKMYSEASRIRFGSPPLYAGAARRVLEAICKDKGALKGTLENKIKYLGDKSILPVHTNEISELLRKAGNASLHGDDISYTKEHSYYIHQLLTFILNFVYIAPKNLIEAKNILNKNNDT